MNTYTTGRFVHVELPDFNRHVQVRSSSDKRSQFSINTATPSNVSFEIKFLDKSRICRAKNEQNKLERYDGQSNRMTSVAESDPENTTCSPYLHTRQVGEPAGITDLTPRSFEYLKRPLSNRFHVSRLSEGNGHTQSHL